jgi:cell wall-associated NlpC family hydrolase
VPIRRVTAAVVSTLLAGSVLVGDLTAATPGEQLKAKRAEAQQVLAQVNALDQRFEASVEAWNGARYELVRTRTQLRADRRMLRIAERQRRLAVARVEARLVGLYESDQPTTIGILLGSTSVSDVLSRLDAAHTVAAADHRLAVQTEHARAKYARIARQTAQVERRRAAAVTQLASERDRIGGMLAERKRLLSSVQGEVAKLKQEEARRQAQLAAQARARLQAQLRALAAARAQAARAAKAAAAEAKRRAAAPTPAPAATTTAPAPTTTAPAPTEVSTDPATQTTTPAPAPASTPAPVPVPAPAALGAGHPEAAQIAMRYLGVRYVWGGATPAGFDCSGLVMYVFAQLGVALPHYAAAQYGFGTPVPRDQLQPGDLVFFDGLNHVGIYVGGGDMIHAPHTGDVVKISPLADGGSYVGARRI